MIVVDASLLTDLLTGDPDSRLFRHLQRETEWHAPCLLDLEVTQALRRMVRAAVLEPGRAAEALFDLARFPLERHPHQAHLARIWQLRDRLTPYDAVYLALAEYLGGILFTRDRALAAVAHKTVGVELI